MSALFISNTRSVINNGGNSPLYSKGFKSINNNSLIDRIDVLFSNRFNNCHLSITFRPNAPDRAIVKEFPPSEHIVHNGWEGGYRISTIDPTSIREIVSQLLKKHEFEDGARKEMNRIADLTIASKL